MKIMTAAQVTQRGSSTRLTAVNCNPVVKDKNEVQSLENLKNYSLLVNYLLLQSTINLSDYLNKSWKVEGDDTKLKVVRCHSSMLYTRGVPYITTTAVYCQTSISLLFPLSKNLLLSQQVLNC